MQVGEYLFGALGTVLALVAATIGLYEHLRAPAVWIACAAVCCYTISGACWIVGRQARSNPRDAAVPPTRPEDLSPPTVQDLFKRDLPAMKLSGRMQLSESDHTKTATIEYCINQDFQARSMFLMFYIPHQPDAYQICGSIPGIYRKLLDDNIKNFAIMVKIPGDTSTTSLSQLSFTGRVYIYYEDELSLQQLAALDELYRTAGLSAQFRGPEYATTAWLAERAGAK